MPPELRFVFDTNSIVSAVLLKGSVPRQAFYRAIRLGKLLVSAATLEELNEVLRRQGFDKYVLEEERIEFITAFVREAILAEVTEKIASAATRRMTSSWN